MIHLQAGYLCVRQMVVGEDPGSSVYSGTLEKLGAIKGQLPCSAVGVVHRYFSND